MYLRMLQGPHMGEIREFPNHIGKSLLQSEGLVEQPSANELDEYEDAVDAGSPLPVPDKVAKRLMHTEAPKKGKEK